MGPRSTNLERDKVIDARDTLDFSTLSEPGHLFEELPIQVCLSSFQFGGLRKRKAHSCIASDWRFHKKHCQRAPPRPVDARGLEPRKLVRAGGELVGVKLLFHPAPEGRSSLQPAVEAALVLKFIRDAA